MLTEFGLLGLVLVKVSIIQSLGNHRKGGKQMQIIANNSVVFNYGEAIESGRWENDPSIDTYRITKNGY